MSFLVPDYINRDLPLTNHQRKAIRKEAWRLWMKDWRNVLIYLAVIAVMLGGAVVLGWYMGQASSALPAGTFLLILVLYTALGWFVNSLFYRFRFAPLVRRVIQRYGYETCNKCGHWMRGLTTDIERCSERGAPREPTADQSGLQRLEQPPAAHHKLPPSGFDQWT